MTIRVLHPVTIGAELLKEGLHEVEIPNDWYFQALVAQKRIQVITAVSEVQEPKQEAPKRGRRK